MNPDAEMVYFDWAGAALPRPELVSMMTENAIRCAYNPEAVHPAGRMAKEIMAESSARLAAAVAGRETPVVWAGSGTELFRLASAAAAIHAPREKVILSTFEHPACYEAWKNFPGEVVIVPPEKIADAADENTGFVLVSHVQSVLGSIFPLSDIFAGIRCKSSRTLIFADTIQSACRFDLPDGADFYSISAAKAGSPAGGAAWLAATQEAKKMLPLFHRLRQEFYLTGREEPFRAAMLAHAAELQRYNAAEETEKISRLNIRLRKEFCNWRSGNGKRVNATLDYPETSPWILHLNMPGIQSAVILRMLAEDNICVSAGSACQAESGKPDAAMKAGGFSNSDAYSGLRISFGFSSTEEQVLFLAEKLKEKLENY